MPAMNPNMPRSLDTMELLDNASGYPAFYITRANACLCAACANKQESRSNDPDYYHQPESFAVVGYGINYEDNTLYCDDCSKRIESAYAEDTADGIEGEAD